MLDVIMISQGQGLACRKQHRVVSDAVEIKGQGLDWNIGYKKKNYFYLSPHAVITIMVLFYFFIVFFIKNL